jgi:transposase
MQAQSGNINDVEGFKKIVKSHVSSHKAAQKCRYLVADAALYVKETIVELDALGQLFITRVPQKLKEAKTLIQSANFLIFAPFVKATKVSGTLAIMVMSSRSGHWCAVSKRRNESIIR